jgi:hypothetical protein
VPPLVINSVPVQSITNTPVLLSSLALGQAGLVPYLERVPSDLRSQIFAPPSSHYNLGDIAPSAASTTATDIITIFLKTGPRSALAQIAFRESRRD